MFLKLNSATVIGLECLPVDIEIDINRGQSGFFIVGLTDTSIQEARSRLQPAMKNSDFEYPYNFRILINLAPADQHKEGPLYDLAMATGIVLIHEDIRVDLTDALIVGELALDGSVRHINGILSLALFAKETGLKRLFVPEIDAPEAALVEGITVYPVKNLSTLIAHLIGEELITPHQKNERYFQSESLTEIDLCHIKGQEFAKRALEIAAAGGHNLLMNGPPGSGKTLLARALPSILPSLTMDEALQVTKIYSVAGMLTNNIISTRPFRSPHHTISNVALVGGGRLPRPGEISLAHRGVLFLDEFPEFPRVVLETLRQPLEDGVVTISRAQGTLSFPARFILIASQNPCPCGNYTDPDKPCTCTAREIIQYRKKISGPLLDRIDLHVEVPRIDFEKLSATAAGEPSARVRERVEQARQKQTARFHGGHTHTNAEMRNHEIEKFCRLNETGYALLKQAGKKLNLSARGYHRVLKLARTIADLADAQEITNQHLAEALQYRPRE